MKHEEIWLQIYNSSLNGRGGNAIGKTGYASAADDAVIEYNQRFPNGEACVWENCPCTPKTNVRR